MGHWYTDGQLAAGRREDMDREAAREALRSEARANAKVATPAGPARDQGWRVRLKGFGTAVVHLVREPRAAVQGIHR
jgi:hypothetical protein